MKPAGANEFHANVAKAMADPILERALARLKTGFQANRNRAAQQMPEFETLRDHARDIKDHTLANLDFYLERLESKVHEQGGQVHWATNAEEACKLVGRICDKVKARKIIKSKSMVTEEIGLNQFLQNKDFEVIETDLGEYIIQLRQEHPSHIIAPAIHVSKEQVACDFKQHHAQFAPERNLDEARSLLDEARQVLRNHFLGADVGITGANFLIAETGTSVMVTNEGNGDLTQTLPPVHIVVTGIEKVVPTLEDCSNMLRVLARSATGQQISVYTTFTTGPKRTRDQDGPEEYHLVLLDNGRSRMLNREYRDVLRCIRCGACMNYCPVYGAIGGHAYGWVYPGPIGSVISPQLAGLEPNKHLPHASTLCGKCEEVCPTRIPLPRMLRSLRRDQYRHEMMDPAIRKGLGLWAFMAKRPRLYRFLTGLAARLLEVLGGKKKRLAKLPFASGWTNIRDLPAPTGKTFHQRYQDSGGGHS